MLRSLVGSEMCIRDRVDSKIQANVIMNRLLNTIVELRDFDYDYYYGKGDSVRQDDFRVGMVPEVGRGTPDEGGTRIVQRCLLYTSDAADEEDSVDLGGRRIIKKKNKKNRLLRYDIFRKYRN
eukprot:TRINITY_DN65426_c0_g1_i1.p1 TRINITY_DN65426_c0_g1~~TRINITY_DN65426_c0_g1_i1.p1  ORF type:complete len:123 (+),score=27.22 TRINITY_DN65426_c0_g1_i1:94-462(+)